MPVLRNVSGAWSAVTVGCAVTVVDVVAGSARITGAVDPIDVLAPLAPGDLSAEPGGALGTGNRDAQQSQRPAGQAGPDPVVVTGAGEPAA